MTQKHSATGRGHAWPEITAKPNFESGKGRDVRPSPSVDNRGESSPIHAGHLGDLSQTAPRDRLAQVHNEPARHFSDRLIDDSVRPIRGKLGRGLTGRPGTHGPSIAPSSSSTESTLSEPQDIITGRYYSMLPGEVKDSLENYKPKSPAAEWTRVRPFVLDAVAAAYTPTTSDIRRLIKVVGPFVLWCTTGRGLPLDSSIVFAPRTIEAYCETLSDGALGSYRPVLVRISRALVPEAHTFSVSKKARRLVKPPYTPAEIVEFRAWARGQRTVANRRKATLMLALSAGTGLWPAEIALVQPEDIVIDSAGVLVTVRGDKPRRAPVFHEWEADLRASISEAKPGTPLWYVSKPVEPNKNVLTQFTSKSMGKAPTNARLRATWLTRHLALGTPMKALLSAAGLTQFSSLHHYLAHVDEPDSASYRTSLRGCVDE